MGDDVLTSNHSNELSLLKHSTVRVGLENFIFHFQKRSPHEKQWLQVRVFLKG